jgi:hypothetical protein
MVILAKKRHARRNGRKNRCYSKDSPQHERHTVASPVDRSGVNQGKGFNARQSSCAKIGSGEIEAEEVISVETEKRKACWVRTSRMKRMTRASTQGKQSV